MNKTIIIYCPVFEFHAFGKCNVFIHELKKRIESSTKIVCAVPEVAIGLIPEANELLILNKDFEFSKILNVMTCTKAEFGEASRDGNSKRQSETINFINSKYSGTNFEVLFYGELSIQNIKNETVCDWYTVSNLGTAFVRDFGNICKYIRDNNYYKPTKTTYNKIKNKFGHLFNNQTYIFLTRNFKNKQPEANTLALNPNLLNLIHYLKDRGIKIINIGFPVEHLSKIDSKYFEISEDFTQDELMSLFYLSKGIFLSGQNGGFSVHACTINNIFMFHEEWSRHQITVNIRSHNYPWAQEWQDMGDLDNRSILENRLKNNYHNLLSEDIQSLLVEENFEKIYELLSNAKRPKLIFNKAQKTILINERK